MDALPRSIRLKDVDLPTVVQSPMANCTDLPFRLVGRAYGMRFAFLEMISAEGLLRGNRDTLYTLQRTAEDTPVGAQLVGCEPEPMGQAAAMLEGMGFSLIDLNLGCPVPKVVSKGGGSSLLREPDTAGAIFSAVVRAVTRVPITVKMRLGYSDGSGEEAARIARIAQDAGVSAVAVHGRTRAQGYTGAANYDAIGRVKAAVSIPVIGNGDVVDLASARELRRISGCDGVMLGRGALGDPWIYRRLEAGLCGGELPPEPTLQERKAAVLRHMALGWQFGGGERYVGPLRRILGWYFTDLPGVREFRDAVNRARTKAELLDLLEAFVAKTESSAGAPA
jgi:nifR3 family TIM-barrel protein